MALDPIDEKWRSFGWHVIAIDGHDFEQVLRAFDEAATITDKPTLIWAKTVKGKGVSFMENVPGWHGKTPTAAECEQALSDLASA
jgi:transketolase